MRCCRCNSSSLATANNWLKDWGAEQLRVTRDERVTNLIESFREISKVGCLRAEFCSVERLNLELLNDLNQAQRLNGLNGSQLRNEARTSRLSARAWESGFFIVDTL